MAAVRDELEITPGGGLRGRLRMPGDKSISHRALIFNGLARGSSRVTGLLDALDVQATARCMQALGVRIEHGVVHGTSHALSEPSGVLDCGNSGTGMRLLAGLLAGQDLHAVLTGDDSLVERPMGRVAVPLREMGARVDGREGGKKPPLALRGGGLHGITWDNPIASAQVKSCLLLANLGATGLLRYREPHLSRDHSERMLGAMGMDFVRDDGWLVVAGGQQLEARDVDVPGDISSAAFFLVAASIAPGSELLLEHVGLNPTRTGILDALDAMGADVTVEDPREVSGEPVGDLLVRHAELRGARIDGALIPRLIDEIPVLAVAAACADGETVFADAAELRVKETDRAATTVALLKALDGRADERPDGLVVEGGPLTGGHVHAEGDHRIAMAGCVAGLVARGPVTVYEAANVATSFPTFLPLLSSVRA